MPIDPETDLLYLRDGYGYVPGPGDEFVVYKMDRLIVIHPALPPRLYRLGCGGLYSTLYGDLGDA